LVAFEAFKKLVSGLTRTREGIGATLRSVFSAGVVDEAALDDLEGRLLASDVGPSVTDSVLSGVRAQARAGTLDGAALRAAMRRALRAALEGAVPAASPAVPPRVVFIVGVNGGGKTTTIGKLAARERALGRKVIVAAADTFRAAAIDQLERWAERAGVEVVRQKEGSDPSAVVFDALRAARARGVDTVLVDTAGRLHTKAPLMAELEKMARVAAREVEGAPHEVLLVIDATTGQNGLAQAREFTKAAMITGVALTKLDGTAKGGVALVIRRELGVPIRYVGVGEGIDDLLDFDADAYVDGLLGAEEVA
jgi:fused signal recognition particle receptor